ncbi:MAG: hypothetical protein IT463_03550 [Planctomycetes bacterium]|nr:hypothetical protein [Planctomycetota bacterium]
MSPSQNGPDDEKTITEIGRELLKYLHKRLDDLGINQASYRQARMELLKRLEGETGSPRFNWGFEAVFTQEIHLLEELGLVTVKYGSGAIMAGRTNANQIYNVALTNDGMDTARIIVDREVRVRAETAKLKKTGPVDKEGVTADDETGEFEPPPDTTKVAPPDSQPPQPPQPAPDTPPEPPKA